MLTLTIQEYRKLTNQNPNQKYNNTFCECKTIFRGRAQSIKAKSKKELTRKLELVQLWRTGKINDLYFEEPFLLVEKSATERPLVYIADAVYNEKGKWIIEDIKGHRTQLYISKRKQVKKIYPNFEFKEI